MDAIVPDTQQIAETQQEIPVTYTIALKIWWAYMWRALLAAFALGVLLGIVAAFIATISTIPPAISIIFATILPFFGGIGISIYVFKYILSKKFSDFRVAIVKM